MDVASATLERITRANPLYFTDITLASARWTGLPFYNRHSLIEAQIKHDKKAKSRF